jgi:hypothetical protein
LTGIIILLTVSAFLSNEEAVGLNKQSKIISNEKMTGMMVISPKIPDQMSFAGERTPLEKFDVRERIDREMIVNTYWHSATILTMKRSNRWLPVIEPILKKNQIPEDFKYVVLVESGLLNLISPAGATGFWQFLNSTAKEYELEVNDEVDERYNVEKSTEAACKYIKAAYDSFASWTMAAAAFNMGISGLRRQAEKQKTNDYYDLLLSEETSRYIARVLALKEILSNPVEYGYFINTNELYPKLLFKEIEVHKTIKDLTEFAFESGISYKTLKTFNPWLRGDKLSIKNGKVYKIKIPIGDGIETVKLE